MWSFLVTSCKSVCILELLGVETEEVGKGQKVIHLAISD